MYLVFSEPPQPPPDAIPSRALARVELYFDHWQMTGLKLTGIFVRHDHVSDKPHVVVLPELQSITFGEATSLEDFTAWVLRAYEQWHDKLLKDKAASQPQLGAAAVPAPLSALAAADSVIIPPA